MSSLAADKEVLRPDLSAHPLTAKAERDMDAPATSALSRLDGTVRSLVRGAGHGHDEGRNRPPLSISRRTSRGGVTRTTAVFFDWSRRVWLS